MSKDWLKEQGYYRSSIRNANCMSCKHCEAKWSKSPDAKGEASLGHIKNWLECKLASKDSNTSVRVSKTNICDSYIHFVKNLTSEALKILTIGG